jgi:hypothetical protein
MLESKPLGTSLNGFVARRTRLDFSKLNTPELAHLPPAYWQDELGGGYDKQRPI